MECKQATQINQKDIIKIKDGELLEEVINDNLEVIKEDIGIGDYEYWGMKSFDSKIICYLNKSEVILDITNFDSEQLEETITSKKYYIDDIDYVSYTAKLTFHNKQIAIYKIIEENNF